MEKTSHNRKDNCVWDFVLLNPLTEESFLKTLHCRFKQEQIYTCIGNELISVNPYKNLEIYSKEFALTYLFKVPFQLPPHIFSTIAKAYRWLIDSNEDQCIIMTGESGSGKTEVFKKMLNFLHFVTNSNEENIDEVKKRIMNANVFIEAFGNAETLFNKNSSRFGKFLDIEFNFKGDPVSACYSSYLLDKDRITLQLFGERNFHIFYQLLCGADVCLLKTLKLHRNVLMYSILKNGGSVSTADEDKYNFTLTKKAMEAMNFDDQILVSVFKIISVVLKLGNLIFVSVTNIDGTEGCSVSNEHEMYEICQLLGIEVATFKTVVSCRNVYVLQTSELAVLNAEISAEEASRVRDSLCKTLYSRLFTWLMKSINTKIKAEPRYRRRRLSFLDLFGFENLEKNSIHQFIVNYCNEKIFNDVFEAGVRIEQEEYIRERLEWTATDYVSTFIPRENDETIYEELFSLLDYSNSEHQEAKPDRLVQKLNKLKLCINVDDCSSSISEHTTNIQNWFKIKHCMGEVTYDIFHFINKNNDIIRQDVSTMMFQGTHPLLKTLFPEGAIEMSSYKKQPSPYSKQIKIAVNGILRNLQNKQLHYVRCFKPNDLKDPHIFEANLVLRQMRTQKIIETVRLRRNGFSFRLPHLQFLNRYKMLSLETWPNSHLAVIQSIQYLLRDIPIPSAEFAFGTTKMFIRSPRSVFELEEYRRRRLNDIAVIIQSIWRKFHCKQRFLLMRRSQIVIATSWRIYWKRKQTGMIKCKLQRDWAVEIIQRCYIQWKRYKFLQRLISELKPHTMSPLDQHWPSCSIRLAETSLWLRKLHHKWRCQLYRRQFNQTSRNKMREKVTASYLFKNKKCCYPESVSKPFVGDYVRVRQNSQWKKIFYNGNDHHVVFADIINKIARSTGKFIPMLLVISTNSIILMDQRTFDIKYRVPVSEIYRISLSPFEDNIAVVHIQSNDGNSINSDVSHCFSSSSSNMKNHSGCFFVADYYEKGDIIFQTNHVIEVVTKLFLVIQNAVGRSPDVNISASFNAYFHQQIVTISFYYVTSTANTQLEQIKIARRGQKMEIYIIKNQEK